MRRYRTRNEEMEDEATYFAMCLLIPESMLAKENLNFDWADDVALRALAKKYCVSVGIMALRIQDFKRRH